MAAKQIVDDDLDENGILKDGRTLRVSMQMRDSLSEMQRAILDSKVKLHDGLGNAAGFKPGYVFAADPNARTAVADAYRDYDKRAAEAWRSPSSVPTMPNDRRMTLDQVYAQRDLEDQNAWRRR